MPGSHLPIEADAWDRGTVVSSVRGSCEGQRSSPLRAPSGLTGAPRPPPSGTEGSLWAHKHLCLRESFEGLSHHGDSPVKDGPVGIRYEQAGLFRWDLKPQLLCSVNVSPVMSMLDLSVHKHTRGLCFSLFVKSHVRENFQFAKLLKLSRVKPHDFFPCNLTCLVSFVLQMMSFCLKILT